MIAKVSCRFCTSGCGLRYNTGEDRLLKITKAPCETACPAGIDVPHYIRCISDRKFDEAIAVIREKVPFPGVLGHLCARPCEAKCQRHETDEALAIRSLKRVAFEHDTGLWKQNRTIKDATGKRIAIVGSGPAGLTAAYYLALFGHSVVVFEALPVIGGMMHVAATVNKLPEEVLEKEIEEIQSVGVEIRPNHAILSLDELFSFSAVFVSIGTQQSPPYPLLTGKKGRIIVDPDTFATSREGVFAGGHVVTGPSTIVHVIAASRRAASAIDRYLGYTGEIQKTLLPTLPALSTSAMGNIEGFQERRLTDMGTADDAIMEAKRCLWCDLVVGDPSHPISHGWSCRRGRAHTARRVCEPLLAEHE